MGINQHIILSPDNYKNNEVNINFPKDNISAFNYYANNNYVNELVDYYKNIGVDKFILGDNNDKDSERLADVLKKEIDEGLVDILDFTGRRKHQTDFFKDSYEMYKDKCRWISFYDFDEFLELKEENKPTTVQKYFTEEKFGNCDVILINWVVFGDNDLLFFRFCLLLQVNYFSYLFLT